VTGPAGNAAAAVDPLGTVRLLLMDAADVALARAGTSTLRGFTVLDGAMPPPRLLDSAAQAFVAGKPACWHSHWMIVDASGAIAGTLSVKGPPVDGVAEVGYGVAPSRQNQGLATAALRQIGRVARDKGLRALVAETAVDNLPSQRALAKAGFALTAQRDDPDDGAVLCWRQDL
jgi:RimJ/RimL family protein N-acetyltransferase